ncbi:hypothetical protein [Bradyrhizobium sp. USDA 10063]
MSNEERLKAILAKQTAADQAKKEAAAKLEADKRVAEVRANEVAAKWAELKPCISKFIATTNASMSGRKLGLRPVKPQGPLLDLVVVIFEGRSHDSESKKCEYRVFPNGALILNVGNRRDDSVKHYEWDVLSVTIDQMESAILDFLDINVSD